MFQTLSEYRFPDAKTIDWAFGDRIDCIHCPDLLITCINLLTKSSWNTYPCAIARLHTPEDLVNIVDCPYIVDRDSHMFPNTRNQVPLSKGRAEYSTQQE